MEYVSDYLSKISELQNLKSDQFKYLPGVTKLIELNITTSQLEFTTSNGHFYENPTDNSGMFETKYEWNYTNRYGNIFINIILRKGKHLSRCVR